MLFLTCLLQGTAITPGTSAAMEKLETAEEQVRCTHFSRVPVLSLPPALDAPQDQDRPGRSALEDEHTVCAAHDRVLRAALPSTPLFLFLSICLSEATLTCVIIYTE